MSLAFQLRWLKDDVNQILFPDEHCDREDGLAAIERLLAHTSLSGLLKPESASVIVDAMVEEDCWKDILCNTEYPYQFALLVICALPYRNRRAPLNGEPTVRALIKQWLSIGDAVLDGPHPQVLEDFTDALFGLHWRDLVRLPHHPDRETLATAILKYKPPFAGAILGGQSVAEPVDLPDLVEVQ